MNLNDIVKHFNDEDKARDSLEKQRWPRWRDLPALRRRRRVLPTESESWLQEPRASRRMEVRWMPQAIHGQGGHDLRG